MRTCLGNERGFSLLEMLVAVFSFVIVAMGTMGFLKTSQEKANLSLGQANTAAILSNLVNDITKNFKLRANYNPNGFLPQIGYQFWTNNTAFTGSSNCGNLTIWARNTATVPESFTAFNYATGCVSTGNNDFKSPEVHPTTQCVNSTGQLSQVTVQLVNAALGGIQPLRFPTTDASEPLRPNTGLSSAAVCFKVDNPATWSTTTQIIVEASALFYSGDRQHLVAYKAVIPTNDKPCVTCSGPCVPVDPVCPAGSRASVEFLPPN